jgi:hypothetical protein
MASLSVPTIKSDREEELDINGMSAQGLAQLKMTDAFMCHSIPAVHKAEILFKDVNDSIIATAIEEGNVVNKQRRLTVECHPDKFLMEELLDANVKEGVGTDEDMEMEDDFYSYLALFERMNSGPVTFPFTATASIRPQQLSTGNLSVQALEVIKLNDPFMFYSIPELRKAAMLNKLSVEDIDVSSLTQVVDRQKRITFECHGDLFLADELIGVIDGPQEEVDEDDEDLYLSVLFMMFQGQDEASSADEEE